MTIDRRSADVRRRHAGLALATTAFVPVGARAADHSPRRHDGKSAAGETLGGVTVSAKPTARPSPPPSTPTKPARYYFPPMPAGKYRVWAQALTFETAKSEVDLSAKQPQDFKLAPARRTMCGNCRAT